MDNKKHKHKKHKHSKKHKSEKKKRKVDHDDSNLALISTIADNSSSRKRYYSSSDLDSSDDEDDVVVGSKLNNMIIPYNNSNNISSIEGLKLDRKGDKDLALDIGIYRLDIPTYSVTILQGLVSSKYLNSSSSNNNNRNNDSIDRYFHSKNRKLITDNTISRLRLRLNSDANKISNRGLSLESSLGIIPTTHYNSVDDEIDANTNINISINGNVNTDAEVAEKLLVERNKHFSKKVTVIIITYTIIIILLIYYYY